MRKTMNIWVLIALCTCVLIGFFWYNHSLTESLDEINAMHDANQVRLAQMQGEQADLEAMLDTVGTDAFIENQARTIYKYMMPDEIRFTIDNPEALYGTEEMPSP